MDILQLYQDYSVDAKTEGHKHCRPGWVNVECPWCSTAYTNAGYHLGYDLNTDHYVCWRCGFHPVIPTIALLLHIDNRQAYKIVKQYGLLVNPYIAPKEKERPLTFEFPPEIGPLRKFHKEYLRQRNFDPDLLEKKYNLMATGSFSIVENKTTSKKINYKHRILIPYYWNYEPVTFDARDITGEHPLKYMACPDERELIPHKEILYGSQAMWDSRIGICVEGPSDVWRMGDYSFAVSGIKYTNRQVRLIAKMFKRVAVFFDANESQAINQANLLIGDLRFRGVDAFRVDIEEGDPGSLSQKDADYIVKQLIK